jgi:hypothetical protein
MLNNRLTRRAIAGLLWLPLLACSSGSTGGGAGGTSGTGGAANGGMTGTGGAQDAGPPNDAGHDTSGGGCWIASDCRGGAFCSPPGQTVCGGACIPVTNPCNSDSQCATDAGAPKICDIVPCSCPTNMACVAGCTSSAECLEGQSCGANHHCVPIACGSAGQTCPTDFVCSTSAGTCVRKPCTSDSQCSNACVLGSCYRSPGACRLAVP